MQERIRLACRNQRDPRDNQQNVRSAQQEFGVRRPGADADAFDDSRARARNTKFQIQTLLAHNGALPRGERRVRGRLSASGLQAVGKVSPGQGGQDMATFRRRGRPVERKADRSRQGERQKHAFQTVGSPLVRPDHTSARGQQQVRIQRGQDAEHSPGALRKTQAHNLSAHRQPRAPGGLPERRRKDAVRAGGAVRKIRAEGRRRKIRLQGRQARIRQQAGQRPLRHNSDRNAQPEAQCRRTQNLRHDSAPLHSGILSGGAIRRDRENFGGRLQRVPHRGQGSAGAGLAGRVRENRGRQRFDSAAFVGAGAGTGSGGQS